MSKMFVLSGPSCVGKSPLISSLEKFYPQIAERLQKLVLFNCRLPRPGERDGRDYHFRSRQIIESFKEDQKYVVADIRGDLQAIDLEQLTDGLKQNNILFEGNPLIVEKLFKNSDFENIARVSIFISPLSKEEIEFLNLQSRVDVEEFVTDVMRRKLLRRTQRQKGILSHKDLENIERRASSAYKEMRFAAGFDYVIANHDGEDSDNWDSFYYPIGDAKKTLECFAALLDGTSHSFAEQWHWELFK